MTIRIISLAIILNLLIIDLPIVFWEERSSSSTPDPWKDIILVAPMSGEDNWCYKTSSDGKGHKFEKVDPNGECWENGIKVQRLEIWSEDKSATWLINKYVWMIFTLSIKFWIIIAIWAIVIWWIMVSSSWSQDKMWSWKTKIIWWVVGFLLLILSWVILHTINPLYFVW